MSFSPASSHLHQAMPLPSSSSLGPPSHGLLQWRTSLHQPSLLLPHPLPLLDFTRRPLHHHPGLLWRVRKIPLSGSFGFRMKLTVARASSGHLLAEMPVLGSSSLSPSVESRRFAVASGEQVLVEAEETPTDSIALPYSVNSSLTVESWGTLYEGPGEEKYWNSTKGYPYPVGYTSVKTYRGRLFRQTVVEGPAGPLFLVEEVGKATYSSSSPAKVWNDIVQDGQRVHGSRHFGFRSPDVQNVLKAIARRQRGNKIQKLVNENEAPNEEREEAVLNTDMSEEKHEVVGETILEERGNLSLDGYSSEQLLGSERLQHKISQISETSALLSGSKRSFRLSGRASNHKALVNSDELKKHELPSSQSFLEEASENGDIGAGKNAVYQPPSLKPKTTVVSGSLEKQIWKRGEGLKSRGIGPGKQQIVERPVSEQGISSNELVANQPRVAPASSSNASKLWESSFPRKKDDSLKSSHLLLELLQKWNKIKKWNNISSEKFNRGRGENKALRLQNQEEENDVAEEEGEMGFEETSPQVNKSVPQELLSETNLAAIKVNPSDSRKAPGQKMVQVGNGSQLGNGKSVLEELKITNFVDESTNYAISRLFETVGKKSGVQARDGSQSRIGKSVLEEPKVINFEDKSSINGTSRFSEAVEKRSGMQAGDGSQGTRKLMLEEPKVVNLVDKMVTSRFSETIEKISGLQSVTQKLEPKVADFEDESTNYVTGRLAETVEKKSGMHRQGKNETQLVEDVRKLISNRRFEDALAAVRDMKLSGMHIDESVYEAFFRFRLDPWQKQVFRQLRDGNSVLVSAPSGAGKSAAAECCLYRTMVNDQRALFVTPYERLAQQQFHKFGEIFGCSNVGGMWSRMSVWRDTKLVVITLDAFAKVLRDLNGPGGSEYCFFFEGVNLVVLDKFHTIGDAAYGCLWEEVLMLMDAKIRTVALALPANNADQVSSWIDNISGPCKLVSCGSEPVRKRYLFCDDSGLHPLLDSRGSQMNHIFSEANGGYDSSLTKEQLESFFSCGYYKPSLRYVFSILEENVMLPAIVVFFNVKGCADAFDDAFEVLAEGLLSVAEAAEVESRLVQLGESNPDLLMLVDEIDREGLLKGFAAYHEGKLPFWQHFVHRLIQENLVKLVMVTESILFETDFFVRTIILPSASKVWKDGVSPVPFGEFLGLGGIAGRRGFDIEGNVVFLKNLYSGPKEATSLVLGNEFNISSYFKPSYSLLMNLLAKHRLPEVKKILGRSFSDFVFHNSHAKENKLEQLDRKVLDCLESKADLEVKLFQGLTEVNKQKLLDAPMFTRVDVRMNIHSASQSGNLLPGVLLAVLPDLSETFYMVFGVDNKFRMVPAGALDHVYTKEEPPLDVVYKLATGRTMQPPSIPPKGRWTVEQEGICGYVASGNSESREFVKVLMEHPVQPNLTKEGLHLRKELQVLENQISNLMGKRSRLRTEKQNGELKPGSFEETGGIQSTPHVQSATWKEASRLLKILERVDAFSASENHGAHVKLNPLGMLISRLHHVENELWLAVVMTSKYVKPLLPAEFAGIAATMVSQNPQVECLFTDQRELMYKVTKPVKETFAELEILRKQVAALQGSYIPPLPFDTALAGMVYAWARGKPGTGSFSIASVNEGDVAWKLKRVATLANLIHEACSEISVDMPDSSDFTSLSTVAKRADILLLRYLTADSNS